MKEDRIIVALDIQEDEKLQSLITELKDVVSYVKVGMELFYTKGPDIIKKLKDYNFNIFLDLKLHDIPQTVANTARTLAKLRVDMLNVHANGGLKMMKMAYEAYQEFHPNGKMIAVTQLTSSDENLIKNELQIQSSLQDNIVHLAKLTKKASLDGVVCSAREASIIKNSCGNEFKCITPGIRPRGSQSNDQIRIMTPKEAIEQGSDHLVIGRAITRSTSPKEAYLSICEEIK